MQDLKWGGEGGWAGRRRGWGYQGSLKLGTIQDLHDYIQSKRKDVL